MKVYQFVKLRPIDYYFRLTDESFPSDIIESGLFEDCFVTDKAFHSTPFIDVTGMSLMSFVGMCVGKDEE